MTPTQTLDAARYRKLVRLALAIQSDDPLADQAKAVVEAYDKPEHVTAADIDTLVDLLP